VVSRHLALLRDAAFYNRKKKGKEVFYSVQVEKLVAKLRHVADAIEDVASLFQIKGELTWEPMMTFVMKYLELMPKPVTRTYEKSGCCSTSKGAVA